MEESRPPRASSPRHLRRFETFDLPPGGGGYQPLDVLLIEGLAAGHSVEQVPVDPDHEVPGKVHAFHGNLSPGADRDPDGRARDRDARTAFQHGVEVVGAWIAASGAAIGSPRAAVTSTNCLRTCSLT